MIPDTQAIMMVTYRENEENDIIVSPIITSSTTEEGKTQEDIRRDSDKAREHDRNRHQEHVAILDMREFVADDTLKFDTIHHL